MDTGADHGLCHLNKSTSGPLLIACPTLSAARARLLEEAMLGFPRLNVAGSNPVTRF
jgi:hypothetical protein